MRQPTQFEIEQRNKEIDGQENTDFSKAKKVFQSILKGYTSNYHQTARLDPSDMRFNYTTKQGENRYFNVEIKERNQDMNKYHTLPLKVSKYCDLMDDTKPIEKPLYIVLLNDSEYYIFDLTRLDFSDIQLKNWNINKVEFDKEHNKQKEKQPTLFIPIGQACCHGLIPN